MARAKRGKGVPERAERQEIAPVERYPVVEYRQAFCPVCGTAHGYFRPGGRKADPFGETQPINYWEWTEGFDSDKPFGVIQDMGQGRGRGFQFIGYFQPDEDPDGYFPLVKARLLAAVRDWVAKGWLTENEIADVTSSLGEA